METPGGTAVAETLLKGHSVILAPKYSSSFTTSRRLHSQSQLFRVADLLLNVTANHDGHPSLLPPS